MGSSNSKCCKSNTSEAKQVTEAFNDPWSQAVSEGSLNGVKFLHHDSPDIIESLVNNSGDRAIHVAVRFQYYDILKYLIVHNCNINAKSSKTGNTPLHEAAILCDVQSIRLLIKYGAIANIKNRHNKIPKQLSKPPAKREFNAIKMEKLRRTFDIERTMEMHNSVPSQIKIGGLDLNDKSLHETINAYDTEIDPKDRPRKGSYKPEDGLKFMTKGVGTALGIDVDDIANFLERSDKNKKVKLWSQFVGKRKKFINKDRDLFRLLFGVTLEAHKRLNKAAKQPNRDVIKFLMEKLKTKLSNNEMNFKITKSQFYTKFHIWLYNVYDDLVLLGTIAMKVNY